MIGKVTHMALVLCLAFFVGVPAQARPFYRLESALTLKSRSPAWDYLAIDQVHSHLFLARRDDGATVIDTKTSQPVANIADSIGANAFAFAQPYDRGYAITEEGTATVFKLSTLDTIGKIRFGDNADSATYEPVTNQVVVTMPDSDGVAFIEGKTGKTRGIVHIVSKGEIESPVVDGKGNVFVTLRNRNAVAKIDAKNLKLVAVWDTGKCVQPAPLAGDNANKRLFVGCRGHGNDPRLGVMNATDGTIITTLKIGRGSDGVVYDPGSHRVITSNGVDGNIVVYDQVDADDYKLSEATTTRPYARTMAMDHKTGKLYLVTAQGTADPSRKIKTSIAPFYPNHYFPDTFTLLVYSPR